MEDELAGNGKNTRGSAEVSRRELIKQVGLAGTAAALPAAAATAAQAAAPAPAPRREALETLNAAEADILDAIVARLIPSDENGPGAREARAAVYIDRQLAGPLRALRGTYAAGLAALDEYAMAKKGGNFAKLGDADQDAILTDMEKNVATGFAPSAAGFFNLLRTHTIEGMFSDPYYGGNADFSG